MPAGLTLTFAAALLLAAAAGADAAYALALAVPVSITAVGPDGLPLPVLRLIEGRPAPLRLAVDGTRVPLRLAWMPATGAAADALDFAPTQMRLVPPQTVAASVTGRARGRFRGLRCGLERQSRLGLWLLRRWQDLDCEFLVYPDLAPGRRALLRSPVYRALAASAQLPVTGQGREFERLRDYQSGDNYADLSWKATARRAFPVTRLFQWEQQQEIYFLLDHSRLSRQPGVDGRPQLEQFIATALVGATAASETGDHYGLITFADSITHWIAASSGRAHFSLCRERLLGVAPSLATPDYNRLFAAIRTRLRRRCYLLILANLTERGMADDFRQAARLVSRTHVVLAQSILPPALEAAADASQPLPLYPALAASREKRRIAALAPQLALAGIQFRTVSAAEFLPAAVAGYLDSKRGQRL